ncbi:MAG: polysaccharide biosynthesis protein [Acidobacteriota bacterium]|nr:polysaccharide biosynthesis protein [Acidobacteriota bacterium]
MTHNEEQEKVPAKLWWTRLLSRRIQFVLDAVVLTAAFALAYLLRFDFIIPEGWADQLLAQLPYVVLLEFTALNLAGAHTFVWRYVGIREMRAFLLAAVCSFAVVVVLRFALPLNLSQWRVPLSVAVMNTILAFGGTLALRVVRRSLYERYEQRQRRRAANGDEATMKSVLLIGAGRAGVLAAREIQGRGDTSLDIKGFVDDEPRKQGSVIHGVRVLGTTADLPRLVRAMKIDHVVITIAQAARRDLRRIVEICEAVPVRMRIIPGLYEILQGRVEVSRIRDVQIEDLLGREPVRLDEDLMRQFLAGKVVMITGAGGSIGAELARQVARFNPSSLLLVERAEFALFNVERELRERWPDARPAPLVADVGDVERMRAIFAAHRPQVVLHAAAHKHVPMMEANPVEAVKNNVLATHRLGELAGEFGAEAFILISTDKAVRPTSVMGASKRVAELVVQDLNRRHATRYVAVRFGNVIGSAGSVIPIFREQIARGGPVTVTHPDMVRYFMTIPEAVQLVLQAGAMGAGGEIFVLDMGEPVRILDLARDTITLSGLKPSEDIEIVFTGVRPGEKLFEELEANEETMTRTRHPKIYIGKIAEHPAGTVGRSLGRLSTLCAGESEAEVRRALAELLPEATLTIESPAAAEGQRVDALAVSATH